MTKELQEQAEKICRENNMIDFPNIHLKYNRRGHTNLNTGHISIPIWAIQEGENFITYYLIHEVTHWILSQSHTLEFKRKETEILNRHNLEPIYSKVYVKMLLKDNQIVWDKKTSKIYNRT